MRILTPVTGFRQQAWANGGGRTTELAAGPDREHWRWRISMAHIDADGAFSVLPGVRRQLAPLDGGLELHFDDGERLTAQRLEVLHFDGGREITCHLLEGPGRDFNLMLREGAEGALVLRPLIDSMVILPNRNSRWLVFVVSGSCHLSAPDEHLDLDTGAAAWVQPLIGTRVLIEGAGELALVRLDNS